VQVLLAGSSGFLGSHLADALRADGHEITRLVRRAPTSTDEVRWDPYNSRLPQAVVDEADVVVNLAGSPTAGNPHSSVWAHDLRESRVTTTLVLAEAVARSHRFGTGHAAYVAGSAMAYYGDHGNELVDESGTSNGGSFMTSVVREWEAATMPARRAGARVALVRTAPVMDRSSAPLRQLLPLFKLGLGARLGDGRQYFPMISLRDWVGGVRHLVHNDISGPANLCCPITPTNAEFTDALARAVGRRARLGVPSRLLEVGAGRVSPELLGSTRLRPDVLPDAGYIFRDHDVRDVLAAALG
jgi:uncharacterized protein (TIGR01777 family)